MNQQEDHVITMVAIGEMSGGNLLSREDFLDQYPGTWQELLRTGMSKYIRSDGQTLSRKDGLHTMSVFAMCRNVRQRVAARMANRLAEVTGGQQKVRRQAENYPRSQRGGWPAA
ncbi:MAG: hypothetical protein ACAI44_38895 [Candidatus Sericytochromatia bacterium]